MAANTHINPAETPQALSTFDQGMTLGFFIDHPVQWSMQDVRNLEERNRDMLQAFHFALRGDGVKAIANSPDHPDHEEARLRLDVYEALQTLTAVQGFAEQLTGRLLRLATTANRMAKKHKAERQEARRIQPKEVREARRKAGALQRARR